MMPPVTNTPAGKPTGKDDATRKTSAARPQETAVKCPRCDSPNTKFCYYNNYSLTQPRHFCKTCRRYWTKGGALRNVPIGGGCRKNKKLKSSHRLSADSRDSSGSSDVGGLKFFQGLSPAMDFQLGGLNSHPSNTGIFNNFSNFGDLSSNSPAISPNLCFNLESSSISSPGFTFPLSSSLKQAENLNPHLGFPEMGSMNVHSNLASSIEDLHWKLQQQRLATFFVEDNQKENSANIPSGNIESLIQKPQPILFQNLENSNSKPELCLIGGTSRNDCPNGNLSTELFFSNSYSTAAATGTSSGNNLNDNSSSWSGYQAWTELAQYSSLP